MRKISSIIFALASALMMLLCAESHTLGYTMIFAIGAILSGLLSYILYNSEDFTESNQA